jgi:hypothetical protein
MEQQIKMASKLYHCRDTAKRFYKDEYQNKLTDYKQIIMAVMNKHNLGELEALLKISETESYNSSGMVQMLFMAAVVELIEPS